MTDGPEGMRSFSMWTSQCLTERRIELRYAKSRWSSRPSTGRTKRSFSPSPFLLGRFQIRTDQYTWSRLLSPMPRPQGPAPFPLLGCSRRDLNPCQKLERLLSLATRLRERGDALAVEP